MVIRYKKLIFVDTNDNCRAPMAEMILKRKFLTNPLTIESRGMDSVGNTKNFRHL